LQDVNGPLILEMLSLEPIHGFGIARRAQEGSRGVSGRTRVLFLPLGSSCSMERC
jgi:hypothetical protein